MNFRHPKTGTGVKKMDGNQEDSADTYKSRVSGRKRERRSVHLINTDTRNKSS